MSIDPSCSTVYCLSLDGTVTAIDFDDIQKEAKTTKLSFVNEHCKSAFPTIRFVNGFLFVVGYLKTPKEDDICPNRLFMLGDDLTLHHTLDITLEGKIFCRLMIILRFPLSHSTYNNIRDIDDSRFIDVQRQRIRR